MSRDRILFFGGSGQIGTSLKRQTIPAPWDLYLPSHEECNFSDPASIAKIFAAFRPDLVINSAAYTDVDGCEANLAKATDINFNAVAIIAAHCATANAPLIQLSTDYVFDGTDGPGLYTPESQMNPLNVYGQTKMMGEEAARHGLHWHVILRTSSVFSGAGNNILTRILKQIDTQEEISAPTDMISCPTSADYVAQSIITIALELLSGKALGFGTFHLCGDTPVSRFQFVQEVLNAYSNFSTRQVKLIPILSVQQPGRAVRPLFSAMSSDKLTTVYGIKADPWRHKMVDAIKEFFA